jgi:integral membrane protein (TIGR01906 family)
VLTTLGRFVFVLIVPLVLLSVSLAYAANEVRFYTWGFQRHDVARRVQLGEEELKLIVKGMIGYLNRGDSWDWNLVRRDGKLAELFNEREKQHLADIRGLIWLDYMVLSCSAVVCLAYGLWGFWRMGKVFWSRLAEDVLCGTSLTLGLLGAIGAALLFAFDALFLQFHLFSFANDLWRLDPARDYMIRMFPPSFFFESALMVAAVVGLKATILGAISFLYLR